MNSAICPCAIRWTAASSGKQSGGLLKKSQVSEFTSLVSDGEAMMLGRKERGQLELFITGSLRDLVPDDHVLVRVDRVLDLCWLPSEVAGLYCATTAVPSIDPEVAVSLDVGGAFAGHRP